MGPKSDKVNTEEATTKIKKSYKKPELKKYKSSALINTNSSQGADGGGRSNQAS